MSRNLVRENVETKVYGEHEQRIVHAEKIVDSEWVYVGTYPGGANTTPDSPTFKNSWLSHVTDQLRFRWTLGGTPEIRGKFTGGAEDTVVFTLPTKARPDNDYTIPYAGLTDCVGSLTVEADGDVVWHSPCSFGGPGGDYETIMLAKSTLVGWWRMGENPNQVDLLTDAYPFANSAPGFGSRPIVAYDYSTVGGETSVGPNGQGAADLGGNDDGAMASYGIGGNRFAVTAGAGYGQYIINRLPFTIMCFFLPGYDPATTAPTEVGAGARGHVCGPLTMDGSGSYNIGVGFVWRPYYNDPDQAGPSLQFWRKTSLGGAEVVVPINVAGNKVDTWWSTHGYPTNAFIEEPRVIPQPIVPGAFDPWFHIAVTYDGTNIKTYVNGLLANTTESTFNMDVGVSAENFHIISARIDTGITEFDGELQGAVDEIAMWSEALTGGEILAIVNAMTG